MLAAALVLHLLSAEPPTYRWDGKSPVRLTVGESIRLHVPGCCSHLAVSGFVFDANVVAPDTLQITATGMGKSTLLAWAAGGARVAVAIEVYSAHVWEWDGHSTVRVEVGKPLLLHLPRLARLAVSTGMGPYDLKMLGDDVMELTGEAVGQGQVLGWKSDGSRFEIHLDIREPASDVQVKARGDEQVMVSLPEELVDLREVPRDGGTLLIGTGASGAQYEISVTPVPRKR
jgi:hypothetical protein